MTTLASTDLATCQASTPPNLLTQDRGSGKLRFPNWQQCLPSGKPIFSLNVEARILANMLEVAGAFSVGNGVRLDFYGGGKPIKITSYDNDEQKFTGLVVPLVDGANGSQTTTQTSEASEADASELQTLKNAHAAELKRYAATMQELREQLADAIDARKAMAVTIKDPAAKIKDLEEACAEWSKEADALNSKLSDAGYDTIDGVIADLHSNEDKVADLENAHEIDARRISEAWTRINNLETANGLLRTKLDRRAKRK